MVPRVVHTSEPSARYRLFVPVSWTRVRAWERSARSAEKYASLETSTCTRLWSAIPGARSGGSSSSWNALPVRRHAAALSPAPSRVMALPAAMRSSTAPMTASGTANSTSLCEAMAESGQWMRRLRALRSSSAAFHPSTRGGAAGREGRGPPCSGRFSRVIVFDRSTTGAAISTTAPSWPTERTGWGRAPSRRAWRTDTTNLAPEPSARRILRARAATSRRGGGGDSTREPVSTRPIRPRSIWLTSCHPGIATFSAEWRSDFQYPRTAVAPHTTTRGSTRRCSRADARTRAASRREARRPWSTSSASRRRWPLSDQLPWGGA